MATYVDNALIQYGRMKMCHLLADTDDELHAIAKKLGLKRSWFQNKSTKHYDVCKANREKAIKLGAIPVSSRKLVELIRAQR